MEGLIKRRYPSWDEIERRWLEKLRNYHLHKASIMAQRHAPKQKETAKQK